MRQRLKKIMVPTILWQGEGIRCMKSARTLQCKICMVERKEILSRFRTDRSKVINDNSDIYSSCKCGAKFHKFIRPKNEDTDEALAAEKSHKSKRSSKIKRSRFSVDSIQPNVKKKDWSARKRTSLRKGRRARAKISPNSSIEMEPIRTPDTRLIDTNVPFDPYRRPSINPSNLHLAQYLQYEASTNFEV